MRRITRLGDVKRGAGTREARLRRGHLAALSLYIINSHAPSQPLQPLTTMQARATRAARVRAPFGRAC